MAGVDPAPISRACGRDLRRRLEFIDSTGLSVLVKANQRAEADGVVFGLAGGGTQVRRLLDLTGIAERVTVADTPAELLGD